MTKLKLSEWASIAEIIASIAVVLSIIYVGIEIEQNTKALQNTSYQAIINMMIEGDDTVLGNDDLHQIVMIAEQDAEALSLSDKIKFSRLAMRLYGVWEYIFLTREDDMLNDTQWLAFEPYFVNTHCNKGYAAVWDDNRVNFSTEFSSYIDTEVTLNCETRFNSN